MYTIKPIINHNKRLDDVDLPTSMYRMKNDKIAVASSSSDVSLTKLSASTSAATSSTSTAIDLALSQQITNLLKVARKSTACHLVVTHDLSEVMLDLSFISCSELVLTIWLP